MSELDNQKGKKIKFLPGDGRRKILISLLWVVLAVCLGGSHLLKAFYMNAYLTKPVIFFYGGMFAIAMSVTAILYFLPVFRMDAAVCSYMGKSYGKEKCSYSLQGNRLTLYSIAGESDSIMLEYEKALEVEVPRYILPKVTELLKSCYTEASVSSGNEDGKKKNTYLMECISVIIAAVMVGVVAYRGYLVNEWVLYRVPQGLEVGGYNGNKTEINIPAQVEGRDVIGIRGFGAKTNRQKERVESISIPGSVTYISVFSFVDFRSLKRISMPAGLDIEQSFLACNAVNELRIYGEATKDDMHYLLRRFTNQIDLYLSDCNVIEDEMFSDVDNLKTISLDDTVHYIGTRAFADCVSLQGVACGSGLDIIGDEAFSGCGALWNIEMQEGVSVIGARAFADCAVLNEIVLPESVKILGDAAFAGSGLKSITVYGNVTYLPAEAFYGCSELEYVALGSGMESIGRSAFSGCVNLQKVDLPESMKNIGDSAFYACAVLPQIEIPEHVKTIGNSAFNLCVSLKEITFQGGVEKIGESAFAGAAVETLQIPEGTVELAARAFFDCNALQAVRLPDSLQIIDESAFERSPVKTVFLPDGLTQLGDKAFQDTESHTRTVFCYTEDCIAREQIENTYFDLLNSRNYYALYMVESRSEYEELEEAGKLEDALLMLSADEMIEIYHLSPAEISVENTEWEGYHSENRMFVPDTVAGMTATLRFRDDHVGALYIQMDANTMNREFDWQKDGEYGLVMSLRDAEETYETYFYTDDEGVEYLRVNMNGMDEWFLKAQE